MKAIALHILVLCHLSALGQVEVPFHTNFTSKDFHAHNRNFDIVCDSIGQIYAGNFEGILHFNGCRWKIYKTPDYSRITQLKISPSGHVWGSNVNMSTCLIGDSLDIKPPGLLSEERHEPTEMQRKIVENICRCQPQGFVDDGQGSYWVATNFGIAHINYPSAFSRITAKEGLPGEVLSMLRYKGMLYIGTFLGLFILDEQKSEIRAVGNIGNACWNLKISPNNELYIACSDGLYKLSDSESAVRLNKRCTYSLFFHDSDLLTGGKEGLYINGKKKAHSSDVTRIFVDRHNNIWHCTLFGNVYRNFNPEPEEVGGHKNGHNLFISNHGNVIVTTRSGSYLYDGKRFKRRFLFKQTPKWMNKQEYKQWWSNSIHFTNKDITLMTNAEGLKIFATGNHIPPTINHLLFAMHDYSVRLIYAENEYVLWLGGEFGIIKIDRRQEDALYNTMPRTLLRKVEKKPSQCFTFHYTSNTHSSIRESEYSYKMEGIDDCWSPWNPAHSCTYHHLPTGNYTFMVQSRDMFGRPSQPILYDIHIPLPFYAQWYCHLLYFFCLFILVHFALKWYSYMLVRRNKMLEKIVEKRTLELQEAYQLLTQKERMAAIGLLAKGLIDRILNPLNYICNFSELSLKILNEIGPNVRHAQSDENSALIQKNDECIDILRMNLNKIEVHGKNTARILKAMESLLKESQQLRQLADIKAIGRECIKKFNTRHQTDIQKWGIRIDGSFSDEPILLNLNIKQISQTISDILENSIYAILQKTAHMPIQGKIQLEISDSEQEVRIGIIDNGIGIEKNVLPKIFDPFFSTKSTSDGSGIGLYMARNTVRAHNGKIFVRSTPNTYTLISIVLPKNA